MENQSDRELMKQVQAGDTGPLAVLFERYNTPLFQYLLHLSRNRAQSEDVVQEVFFRVLKYAGSYDPRFAFNVWLYRMARNAYFDSQYKRRAEAPGSDLERFHTDEPAPEEALARKQETMFLQEALGQLPDDKKEILVLSRFHNMRYEEIAQILKVE